MTKEEQGKLYEKYYQKVNGYIKAKIKLRHDVEDLCSDVFLKIFSNLEHYQPSKSSLSTWIYTITRNTVIDYFRTNHQTYELEDDFPTDEYVVDEICHRESLDQLAKALKALSDIERDVILLFFYQNNNIKEIAKKTGFSTSYIKLVKQHALKHLRIFMNE